MERTILNYPIKQQRTLNRLKSAIPSCIGPVTDNTRSILAFGNWILPKLVIILHNYLIFIK
ncbi:hypothetical protein C0J52_12969 [Blattella germanica]|nr:hypothetical protein C0J52_12969 [Blattella germanica]